MWDTMYPGLSRAEYADEPGSVYSISDIKSMLESGEVLGYLQVESGYSGIVSVVQHPRKKLLSTFLGGKDPRITTPIDLEDLDSFLTELAGIFGCDTIHVEGRKGWERWTKPLGYTTSTINLYKGVSQ